MNVLQLVNQCITCWIVY